MGLQHVAAGTIRVAGQDLTGRQDTRRPSSPV